MTYPWVVLSLLSAFCLATSDALAKKAVEHNNEYLVAWFRLLFSLPLLIVILFFIPIPELDRDFFKAFLIALPVELITIVLYIKALKESPLSLTLPFLALTPVFLIFISYIVLGEKVSLTGGIGIFLIASGGYLLNISEIKKGIFEPFRAITREKGSLYMIGVALLYSITSSFGKMAIEHSSPLFFGSAYFIALYFLFTPAALYMGKAGTPRFRSELGNIIKDKKIYALSLSGVFYAIMVITHMTAMKLTKVAYMISIKRISLLIGVFYGYLFFKEENIRNRMLGAGLMLFGFYLIVGSG